jgi:hypothetical protein
VTRKIKENPSGYLGKIPREKIPRDFWGKSLGKKSLGIFGENPSGKNPTKSRGFRKYEKQRSTDQYLFPSS